MARKPPPDAGPAHPVEENHALPPAEGGRRVLGVRRTEREEGPARSEAPRRSGVRTRFKPGGLKPASATPAGAVEASAKPASGKRVAGKAASQGRPDGARPAGPKRVPASRPDPVAERPQPEGVRLSKVMAERGLCSRREADAIIERGWVFVEGERISELGTRIDPGARIELAPEAQKRQAGQVTILLHKPVGYVSGQPEPGFEPAVVLIGPDNQHDRKTAQRFHPSHLYGLAPAGRLDIDSTGLLVLTQNGRIARRLIGEDSKVDKEYLVRVAGHLDEPGLALLNHGLELDGRKLRPAKVEWVNDDQLRFVLREGRKRQIRRMCELVGLRVVGLKRVRIGRVMLGDLPLGEWRYLRPDEEF